MWPLNHNIKWISYSTQFKKYIYSDAKFKDKMLSTIFTVAYLYEPTHISTSIYPTPYPSLSGKVILPQIQAAAPHLLFHITSLTYMWTDSVNILYFQFYFICSLLAVRVTNSFQFTQDCPHFKSKSPVSQPCPQSEENWNS